MNVNSLMVLKSRQCLAVQHRMASFWG